MSALFAASYAGHCGANGCRIDEGDRIGYAEGYDKPLCESCWHADIQETAPTPPCPDCWTIHAGACL